MPRMPAPIGGDKHKTAADRAAEARIKFEQEMYRRLDALERAVIQLDKRMPKYPAFGC